MPPRVDTTARDTTARDTTARDSTSRDSTLVARRVLTAADTIKAPLSAPYMPLTVGARGEPLHWDRASLFATGALTLAELIAQIPGVTLMTTGLLLAPSVPAWHGDPGGVRIFIDGVEREEITPRNGGVTDFSLVPLWSLEDVSVEETAGELRVHARTWRVDRTTASTRTDVLTGSDNLNLFRGYFGKRASNGLAVQFAAQQASMVEPLAGMDGDALGALARLGWARGSWSVDATWLRQGLNRNVGARYLLATPEKNAMPAYHGSTALSYMRVGWRSPESPGAWAQVVASTQGASLTPPAGASTPGTTTTDTTNADTTASQGQYSAMMGLNRGGLRFVGGARLRTRDGTSDLAPLLRLDAERSWAAVSLSAERRFAGAAVWDVRGRLNPFAWMRLSASAGTSQPSGAAKARPGSSLDVAFGLRERWIGAGIVHAAEGTVLAPIELDTAMRATAIPAGAGMKLSAGGPLLRGWNLRTDIVNWGTASSFRPQTEAHTRLWFESNFLGFAPRGNFHVLAALSHEYRTTFFVPAGGNPVGQSTPGFSAFSALVQIRISTATVYWDFRNMSGLNYESFPGYLMPRNVSVYGIRWEFWN